MLAFGQNEQPIPLLGALNDSRCITVCAADMMGRIRYANNLFREHIRDHYGWDGAGESFTIDHLAMGDAAYLRERVDVLTKVLDANGAPVRCIELSGGRAVEHTCVAWSQPNEGDAPLCIVATARAEFDDAAMNGRAPHWLMVPTDPGRLGELTHAELETLRLIAKSMSTEDIAHQLSRTKKAIERRRMSIRRKLHLSDRMALMRLAMESGLGHMPEARLGEFVRCCRSRARYLKRLQWRGPVAAPV